MNYFIDLYSPETAKTFTDSDKNITGFRITKKTYVENKKIGLGDKFICYCTRIQRFIGVLVVLSEPFVDDEPIFLEKDDPFVLRFTVKPLIWLPLEMGIPIHEDILWNQLSFTKKLSKDSTHWTYMVFSSPLLWPEPDCIIIEQALQKQEEEKRIYPFSDADVKKLSPQKIRLNGKKSVTVTIPDNNEEEDLKPTKEMDSSDQRESIKVQAKLSEIGEKLGFKIWLPRGDRSRVLEIWQPQSDSLLEDLPLVFDDKTLKTIQNIDLLWIRRRSIVRAFEVEDTASIYSGILRMADLLSLQPMIDIKIHIVAPETRRDAVFQQITRPVFAVLEKGPLAELCTYISYDSVYELAQEKKLAYMTDSIMDDYAEPAEA